MERSRSTAAGLSFARRPDPDLSPTASLGVIFGPIGSNKDRSIWSAIRVQVLTAYEKGVENVVAFLTDGISAQQLSAAQGRKKRESVELC
jgi:hypothetical protein